MHEFDWSLDLYVRSLIWELRDKRRGKPAKKVDVLNTAANLGMGRERVEQAINELNQMGQIIVLKGGDTDWDRLKIVDEEHFHRQRWWEIYDDLRNPED